MKKILMLLLTLCIGFLPVTILAEEKKDASTMDLAPNAEAAYLIEYTTGKVIYAKNETEKLYPASMTKMMGLLLIYEALHNKRLAMDDLVSTSEYAASMGGSQVYLEPGETMSVTDMLKAICIASANDAMVAMGEKIAGSNEHFVTMMNDKAKELKLENTHFVNATGLHDAKHYSTAKDMAIISQALIKEGKEDLLEITSTYDAYIREHTDDKFWLVNTNKLLKQYEGVDGLKTGYTAEALSCVSVTAKKKDLRLIAVVMKEPDSKRRNMEIRQMLDYGFSQYDQGLLYPKGTKLEEYVIENGKPSKANLITLQDAVYVFEKGSEPKEKTKEIILHKKSLPYAKEDAIGKVKITMSDGYIIETDIGVDRNVTQLSFLDIFKKTITETFC